MDAELKAKWVAALRSGEYEQGSHELRSSEGEYCCLGVLCDITGRDTSAPSDATSVTKYSHLEDLLSERTQHTLAFFNDNGHTFERIADYIEENL